MSRVTCNCGVSCIKFVQYRASESRDRYSLLEPNIQEYNEKIQNFTCSDSIFDLDYLGVCALHISSQPNKKNLYSKSNLSHFKKPPYTESRATGTMAIVG